jgi:hypothetical protein
LRFKKGEKGDKIMEIVVNQDIRKFKTKDIGNFSFKDCAFIAGAGALGYGAYWMEMNIFHMEKISYLPILLLAAIPLAFGFFKPQGMTLWQFINTVVKENLIDLKIYIWESDFVVDPSTFGDIYGEEYELTPERVASIKAQLQAPASGVKMSKLEKEKMVL